MGAIIPVMSMLKPGLSDALFSKVQQRVLATLYGQPDRSFYTNEIIRLSNSGTGAVQREIEKLANAGLITVTMIGNQKHYQANHNNPLYSELRSIVLKTFGLADVLRIALEPVVAEIQIAFIYGSIAKQEDTTTSDIDLMLISDTLTYADLFTLLEKAEHDLGRSVHPTFYSTKDWVRKKQLNNNFIIQVINHAKIFLIGDEYELGKLK